MYEFDSDARLERRDETTWLANLTDRWNIGTVPNGGYLIALAARAMSAACSHPDPLSVTGHYLRPAQPGPAELRVDVFKQGGTFDHAQVSIVQDGVERCRFFGAYGSLARIEGPSWREATPVHVPPPEQCERLRTGVVINERHEALFDPACTGWLRGATGGPSEFRGWIDHADGRPLDASSLLLFADGLPPPVFNRTGMRGWVPTVELTVHLRGQPAPGRMRFRFRSRYVTRGLLESDGELWDSGGELVALSRQLARLRD
jgi:acyl-coenzyme A thioesterase PaaI-like protein